MNSTWQPIYSVERSGIAEVTISGVVSVVAGADGAGKCETLLSLGEQETALWTRSVLKPWQLLSHLNCLKAAYPQLKPEHIALMMSSHNAEELHQRLLSEIMTVGDVTEELLQCPASYPFDADLRRAMRAQGIEPRRLYHNCSGKHFGYLLALKARGGSLSQYIDPEASQFLKLQLLLCELLQHREARLPVTTDGCQMPNYAVTIDEMARLYHGLANPSLVTASGSDAQEALENYPEITRLMSTYPQIIGGTGRIDSELMAGKMPLQGNPLIIAKQGADGLLAIGVGPCQAQPNGLGVLIKVCSGFDAGQMELIVGEIFAQLGLREHDAPVPSQPAGARRDHLRIVHHFQVGKLSGVRAER